jgi:hypothetical protein
MRREIPDEAQPLISAAARITASKFRGYTTYADAHQDAQEFILSKPRKVADWLADGKPGERALKTALRRHCEREARRAKADQLGTTISDEYFFDRGKVTDILPYIFNEKDWESPPNESPLDGDEQQEIHYRHDPAEGGNWLASVLDVKVAFEQMDVMYRRMLRRYYHDGWSFEHIAHTEQRSAEWVRREIGRAVFQIVEGLGGESPWG